jgi:hypothetical protein
VTPRQAALLAIDMLERGGAIGTDCLIVLLDAHGQSSPRIRRDRTGYLVLSRRQRLTTIWLLRRYVTDGTPIDWELCLAEAG